jgi:hypothetical protein
VNPFFDEILIIFVNFFTNLIFQKIQNFIKGRANFFMSAHGTVHVSPSQWTDLNWLI